MGLLDFLSSLGPDELAAKRKAMMQAKLDAAGNAAQGLLAPTTGTFTEGLTRALPLTGEAWTANDAGNAAKAGNYGQAAAMGLLGLLPMGGMMAAGLKAGVKVPSRMGQSGAIAWHGSPHKFDKFSLDKIGTGEGAQAYGHGLYLAEHPETAKAYAKSKTDDDIVNQFWDALDNAGDGYIGIRGDDAIIKNKFRKSWNRPDGNKTTRLPGTSVIGLGRDNLTKAALSDAVKSARRYGENIYLLEGDAPTSIQWMANDIGEKLLSTNKVISSALDSRNIYKTDIPDEAVARFLDWDKPLSQQAPEVQAALQKMDPTKLSMYVNYGWPITNPADAMKETGSRLYEGLGKGKDWNAKLGIDERRTYAAQVLQDMGIPGIRYLDGGSRSGGSGTSNFVAFDPELIRILERNGQATGNQPWKPGEWQGLLGGAK